MDTFEHEASCFEPLGYTAQHKNRLLFLILLFLSIQLSQYNPVSFFPLSVTNSATSVWKIQSILGVSTFFDITSITFYKYHISSDIFVQNSFALVYIMFFFLRGRPYKVSRLVTCHTLPNSIALSTKSAHVTAQQFQRSEISKILRNDFISGLILVLQSLAIVFMRTSATVQYIIYFTQVDQVYVWTCWTSIAYNAIRATCTLRCVLYVFEAASNSNRFYRCFTSLQRFITFFGWAKSAGQFVLPHLLIHLFPSFLY